MWPKLNTAFVVIHGAGSHRPFETLDKFVRGFWNVLNFYHLQDPVSGHLDAYAVDRNILCDIKVKGSAEAHSAYWAVDAMYEAIGAKFFTGLPDVSRA